jgi:CotH kinase protein/Secretion system C-terminal sorting domain
MNRFLPLIFLFFALPSIAQVSFTSSNLPIIKINSLGNTISDLPKVLTHISIINNASGVNNVTDPANDLISFAAVDHRGSTSQSFPKKGYGVELRDSTNNALAINKTVLGLPAESDWIFYGPYTDKTLVRDVLSYRLAEEMGEYAPKCRFVELLLDSVYQGIYVVMQKIKRDNNRVNINKLTSADNAGVAVTGGYILKIDKGTGVGNVSFATNVTSYLGQPRNLYLQIDYPKTPTIQQLSYIKDYIDSFETTLLSANYRDTINGYKKYINVNSFINFFISNEISNNVDGYRLSTYLHKKRITQGDGKLHMGPIWDFNLAFGNADYCDGFRTDSWALDVCGAQDYPFWWQRLLTDTTFANKLKCRYTNLRNYELSNAHIFGLIDSMIATITPAAINRNYTEWPILGSYVWPNYYVGSTYTEDVDSMKAWIVARMNWLDANMFGQLTGVCAITPLSIAALNFTVVKQQNSALLSWQNAKQEIGDYYEIQKSLDGKNFIIVAIIRCDNQQQIDYNWQDNDLQIGKNYYKIVHNSINKNSIASQVQFIRNGNNSSFTCYPNPMQNDVTIQLPDNTSTKIVVNLYDITGHLVLSKIEKISLLQNKIVVNVNDLATGTYLLACTTDSGQMLKQVVHKN